MCVKALKEPWKILGKARHFNSQSSNGKKGLTTASTGGGEHAARDAGR